MLRISQEQVWLEEPVKKASVIKTKFLNWRHSISYSYKGHHAQYQDRNGDSHGLTAIFKIPLGDEHTTGGRASSEAVIAVMVAIT